MAAGISREHGLRKRQNGTGPDRFSERSGRTIPSLLQAHRRGVYDDRRTGIELDAIGCGTSVLRDRYAGPHTPDMASAKAYTAVSFRTNTTELAEATQPGRPASGIRHRPGVAAVGGGMMIEAGGSLLGAIGVSGAPDAREDDACAAAGIAAIREDIEL